MIIVLWKQVYEMYCMNAMISWIHDLYSSEPLCVSLNKDWILIQWSSTSVSPLPFELNWYSTLPKPVTGFLMLLDRGISSWCSLMLLLQLLLVFRGVDLPTSMWYDDILITNFSEIDALFCNNSYLLFTHKRYRQSIRRHLYLALSNPRWTFSIVRISVIISKISRHKQSKNVPTKIAISDTLLRLLWLFLFLSSRIVTTREPDVYITASWYKMLHQSHHCNK